MNFKKLSQLKLEKERALKLSVDLGLIMKHQIKTMRNTDDSNFRWKDVLEARIMISKEVNLLNKEKY